MPVEGRRKEFVELKPASSHILQWPNNDAIKGEQQGQWPLMIAPVGIYLNSYWFCSPIAVVVIGIESVATPAQ